MIIFAHLNKTHPRAKTAKDLKSLIAMIQFYRDTRKRRSCILSPLKDSAVEKKGKTPIIQTPSMDENFIQVKQIIFGEIFLNYPD